MLTWFLKEGPNDFLTQDFSKRDQQREDNYHALLTEHKLRDFLSRLTKSEHKFNNFMTNLDTSFLDQKKKKKGILLSGSTKGA